MISTLQRGEIRLRSVSRRFKIVHERNLTLKETIIRRSRSRSSDLWALRDVSFHVRAGEAVALVGRNGSGKSTLLKVLAGIVPPQSGAVETRGSVASMLELGAGFHPDFTGRENVFMNAAIHGLSERAVAERLPAITKFSELEEFMDMPVRTYSSGMQMRLAFAVAAHVNPDILLLDEVLAVGDEAFQRKCMGRIFDFRRGGGTLVFVSHDPAAVENICDRAILLDQGQVVADGTPVDVVEEYHRLLASSDGGVGGRVARTEPEPGAIADDGTEAALDPPSTLGGWGSARARILSARLTTDVDNNGTSYVAGDRWGIEVTLAADSPVDVTVGVMCLAEDGSVCFGTNTKLDGCVVHAGPDERTVEFIIERLPLHEGSFAVTVALTSTDEREVFHWLDRFLHFSVFGRQPGIGLVDIPRAWEGDCVRMSSPAAS